MSDAALQRSVAELRELVVEGWGEPFESAVFQPLGGGDVVTHTSHLWHVRTREASFMAKVHRGSGFRRAAPFEHLKLSLLRHCRASGAAVQEIVVTQAGEPCWARGETSVELSRHVEGRPLGFDVGSAELMARAALTLRRALEAVPERLRDDLAEIPVLCLVEEPDVPRALEEARALRALALAGDDAWSRLAARYLEPLLAVDAGSLTRAAHARPARPQVLHGDLHRSHFLVTDGGANGAPVIIDFDNATVGDRALDLAWVCDQTGALETPGELHEPGLKRALDVLLADESAVAPELEIGVLRLIHYAIPIVVDIAKDILVRNDRRSVWHRYLHITDVDRKLRILKHINGPEVRHGRH